MKRSELPTTGLVFWPVGTGDSTTILVTEGAVIQVDLNHLVDAEGESDPRYPMIDELIELLPVKDGKPYLAVFIATHADNDHCRGFKRLLEEACVVIGELWFTPRLIADIDTEDPDSLSKDAVALRDEALRRLGVYRRSSNVASGDRIRVIGYHESLEGDFAGLGDAVSIPGTEVTVFDGTERNRTSIGLHVTLRHGYGAGRVLLLGDLDYEPIKTTPEDDQGTRRQRVGRLSGGPPLLEVCHVPTRGWLGRPSLGRARSPRVCEGQLRLDRLKLSSDSHRELIWRPPPPPTPKPGIGTVSAATSSSVPANTPTKKISHQSYSRSPRLAFAFLGTTPTGQSAADEQVRTSRGNAEPVAAAVGFGCN